MSVSVPEQRIALIESEVGVSESVRSVSWVDAVRLHNWIVGRPVTLVPCYRPGAIEDSGDDNFYFRWKPRYQDTRYILRLTLVTASGGTVPTTVTIPVGGTAHAGLVARERTRAPAEYQFVYDLASQSTTEMEFSFSVETDTDAPVVIEACSVEAAPRTLLTDDASDLGLDRLRFWPRSPITQNDLGKLLARQNEVLAAARRVGGFQHAFGTFNNPEFTSGSWTDVFDEPFALLGRYLYSGDTTRTWSWRIRVRCSNGTTAGSVRMSNTSGGAGISTITVPAGTTTATWLPSTAGDPATFTSDCEDPTAADGRRSSRDDEHNVQVQRTAGAGTIYIESICVWEA
jgi:hypothetical protein